MHGGSAAAASPDVPCIHAQHVGQLNIGKAQAAWRWQNVSAKRIHDLLWDWTVNCKESATRIRLRKCTGCLPANARTSAAQGVFSNAAVPKRTLQQEGRHMRSRVSLLICGQHSLRSKENRRQRCGENRSRQPTFLSGDDLPGRPPEECRTPAGLHPPSDLAATPMACLPLQRLPAPQRP